MFIANIRTGLQIFELDAYNYQSLSVSLSVHLHKYSNSMATTIELNKTLQQTSNSTLDSINLCTSLRNFK
jgi:hypothetical protein